MFGYFSEAFRIIFYKINNHKNKQINVYPEKSIFDR